METTIRTHRVGSVTAGLSMIAFGIMFLTHLLFGALGYDAIFRLWPLMLVSLGIELLISNFESKRMVYDKAAIFLLIVLSFFAMGMAVADLFFQYFSDGRVF